MPRLGVRGTTAGALRRRQGLLLQASVEVWRLATPMGCVQTGFGVLDAMATGQTGLEF